MKEKILEFSSEVEEEVACAQFVRFRKFFKDHLGTRGHVLHKHLGRFVADHDAGRIGVTRGHCRHDRSVSHTQSVNAMHTQALVHHCQWVVPHTT